MNFKNLGFGAGFRQRHKDRILGSSTRLDWLEIISENYFGLGPNLLSPSSRFLLSLREKYEIAMHGVSLSIGSVDPINQLYIRKLRDLVDLVQPSLVSDHLCWTGVNGRNLHDLLPLPFTEEAIEHVVKRVCEVQDVLGRMILLENVSSYLTFSHSAIPEWEFLAEISRRSGCGILLDINNIYVSAINHGFDAKEYLNKIPHEKIGQIHLAGHSDMGTHLIDTHDHPVSEPVWELFREAYKKIGPVSTMVEWDDQIPEFEILEAEVVKARTYANT